MIKLKKYTKLVPYQGIYPGDGTVFFASAGTVSKHNLNRRRHNIITFLMKKVL